MSVSYNVHIQDRNYISWKYYSNEEEINIENIHPVHHKLFHNDCFTIIGEDKLGSIENNANNVNSANIVNNVDRQRQIILRHSPTRTANYISGVLNLKTNKTYGRDKNNGKLLYKVVPDDNHLPCFLIPYEIKNMGFSKVFVNLYITFIFTEWQDKHPHGQINQIIGKVDVLDNFYEYQLYCKNLHEPIQKFNKDVSKVLKTSPDDVFIANIMRKYPQIEDRKSPKDWQIFSIDPDNCTDFDDAFSIKEIVYVDPDKCVSNCYLLSIYISNVTIWLDILNLWTSFSRRVSTIYLPDKKRTMLPTILSDYLCSLQENTTRFAFVMDIVISNNNIDNSYNIYNNIDNNNTDDINIIDISYSNCAICVQKNYRYEESKLLQNKQYQTLFNITQQMSKIYKYIDHIQDSHDVVAYLMILMNHHSARELLKNGNGIFRSTISKNIKITKTENINANEKQSEEQSDNLPDNLPDDISKFIQIWNSNTSGHYINANAQEDNTNNNKFRHELLNIDAYIHITSPIRRLIDLLNMIQFQQNKNMFLLSENAKQFYNNWTCSTELNYINTSMRSIRKVQNDCALLELYTNHPEKIEDLYQGYILDKNIKTNGIFEYSVYLPELKITSRINTHISIENYQKHNFKLYLFNDEESLKKKIRLQIIV